MTSVSVDTPKHADFCEECERLFVGFSGSTKWCAYCGAKHQGEIREIKFPVGADHKLNLEEISWVVDQIETSFEEGQLNDMQEAAMAKLRGTLMKLRSKR